MFGVGIYHSGLEIDGHEFAYGGNTTLKGTGVYENDPKDHSTFSYKLTVDMGEITAKDFFRNRTTKHDFIKFSRDIVPILESLSDKYRAYRYDMLTMNCNHFTDEFLSLLTDGTRRLPNWVNRAAWMGSWFHCLVPVRYLIVSPEGQEEEGMKLRQKWLQEDHQLAKEVELSPSTAAYSTEMSINDSFEGDDLSSLKGKPNSKLLDQHY